MAEFSYLIGQKVVCIIFVQQRSLESSSGSKANGQFMFMRLL